MDGLLILDKPAGMTSRAAVDRAARWFPRSTRIGHTGTLDPLATGALVLCLGRATRLAEYVQQMAKCYHSLFRLGATSDSDDAEGQISEWPNAADPGVERLNEQLRRFVGTIEQVPPAFSAAHVDGRRAHRLARQGKEVLLTPRAVRIDAVTVLRYDYPDLEVEVRCGKGTYIRSVARDLGRQLGCGAYVQTLRRLSVGSFHADTALTLDASPEEARARLLPAGQALTELPRVEVGPRRIERLITGQPLDLPDDLTECSGEVGIFDESGDVVAVGVIDSQHRLLRPEKVFAQSKNR